MIRLLNIITVLALCCLSCNSTSKPNEAAINNDSVEAASSDAAMTQTDIDLPQPDLLGPLDPIAAPDEVLMLAIANLGHYNTIEELKGSFFYPMLQSLYPQLEKINKFEIDLGKGDVWLMRPLEELMTFAINEAHYDQLNGENSDNAKVLLRDKEAHTILVHAPMDALDVNVMSNDGERAIIWTPHVDERDHRVNGTACVVDITYNPIDNLVMMGEDYTATAGGKTVTLCFYADRTMTINGKAARYVSYHPSQGNGMGLFMQGDGINCYGTLSFEPRNVDSFEFNHESGEPLIGDKGQVITFSKK